MNDRTFKIVECPREVLESSKEFIATDKKIDYINSLLKVGYHTIDCGSFIASNKVSQMADIEDVLDNLEKTTSKISIFTMNSSGAIKAIENKKVDIINLPFIIHDNIINFNKKESTQTFFELIESTNTIAKSNKKEISVHLSMSFKNSYTEKENKEIINKWVNKLSDIGIKLINISDKFGSISDKNDINFLKKIISNYSNIEFGVHFHTPYNDWYDKVKTMHDIGCEKFYGSIKGMGIDSAENNKQYGNIPTEKLISFANQHKQKHGLNLFNFESSWNVCLRTFNMI